METCWGGKGRAGEVGGEGVREGEGARREGWGEGRGGAEDGPGRRTGRTWCNARLDQTGARLTLDRKLSTKVEGRQTVADCRPTALHCTSLAALATATAAEWP